MRFLAETSVFIALQMALGGEQHARGKPIFVRLWRLADANRHNLTDQLGSRAVLLPDGHLDARGARCFEPEFSIRFVFVGSDDRLSSPYKYGLIFAQNS